jgi:Phospholipase_D-nuclease N-terminal
MSAATLAAEWGTGQVLLSMMWFFLFVLWITLLIYILIDIFRSDDLSGWAKALWLFLIIFLPYFGVFVYLIVRGGSMANRQVREAQANKAAADAYIREVAGGSSAADQLAKLAELHTAGKLDDAEYATAKARVIG